MHNKNSHIYATPKLSFWEKLGNGLRLLKGYRKNGTRNELANDTVQWIGMQAQEVNKWMPVELKMDPVKIERRIIDAISSPEPQVIEQAIQITNHCLRKAVQCSAKESNQKYLHFLQKSLIGSAGVGHSLLKTFERDAAISYEEVDDIRAMTQGLNVKDRMTTRICSWAAGKWKVQHRWYQQEIQEAWERITQACADPELERPKIYIQQLKRILRSWPAKAGLGLDQWVLRLWSELPDEGLRVLINIIYLAMDGIVPMQLLLVLIGLLPKD